MISTELSMIHMLNPHRHKLALLQEAFLSKGGTIEVLEGPAFKPPPPRHEPPPTVKKAKPKKVEPPRQKWIDKMAQRDIEREERALKREQDRADKLEYVRHLAQTMTYAQAVLRTGFPLRELTRLAAKGGFKFQPAKAQANKGGKIFDEERDARNAEMIRDFKARGFTRNQARESIQSTYKNFDRLLEKFGIDYPKSGKGPEPACFDKKKLG
ncbi:hypothetical protein HU742_018290 [Pseudomonas sp. SWRI102]|uniref:Uncharacterized protein n=1 Tax=Pseudomonas marvdashtae TaxID=2745500 RepID=A0A923FLN2_9PSED|nr:hypothetical protein [Pseudomonas marvdashtae]MBV4553098.1 hypothetical protein [Pseudomonas marvdashtae]